MRTLKTLIGLFAICVAIGLIAGCATLSPQEIAAMPTVVLCTDYSSGHDPALKAELTKRGVVKDPKDWIFIDGHAAWVGMTEDELQCSLGEWQQDYQTVSDQNGSATILTYQVPGFLIYNWTEAWVQDGKVTNVQTWVTSAADSD